MAFDLNNVTLIGRLTRDPELQRVGAKEIPLVSNTIAVGRGTTREGEQDTDFIDVKIWSKGAEVVAEYATKGRQVAVVGELRRDSWTNNEGERRHSVYVNARSIQLLQSPSRRSGQDEGDADLDNL